jgi:hypothetical protein
MGECGGDSPLCQSAIGLLGRSQKRISMSLLRPPEAGEAISPHPFAANNYAEIASLSARSGLLAMTLGFRLGPERALKGSLKLPLTYNLSSIILSI